MEEVGAKVVSLIKKLMRPNLKTQMIRSGKRNFQMEKYFKKDCIKWKSSSHEVVNEL
jgi:hypothetical protein